MTLQTGLTWRSRRFLFPVVVFVVDYLVVDVADSVVPVVEHIHYGQTGLAFARVPSSGLLPRVKPVDSTHVLCVLSRCY